jgi:hypothetical protein
MADTASRKWQLTFNNPLEHGWTHEQIKAVLTEFKSIAYWCMSDEKGLEEETPHTHLFINLAPSNCRFSTLKNKFSTAHIEKANGTSQQNREYVSKTGKWAEDEKGETSIEGSFEEFGEMPIEQQGKSKDVEKMLELIKDGATNQEIVEAVPSAMLNLEKVERTRSMIRDSQFTNSWRDLETTYIFGLTGTGKTRSVMETYGYQNCYRVTDYKHPFDAYDGQDIIILEEFRSSTAFKVGDILNYLDGYPLQLPCRYFNRQACYTKVFIISNISLESQYTNVAPESKAAFLRRVHRVTEYTQSGKVDFLSVDDYMTRNSPNLRELPECTNLTFTE